MIIGFTGNIGAGKSTASALLVKEFGFKKVSFKDALIAEMKERLPTLIEEIRVMYSFDTVDEMFASTPRPSLLRALMQNYGSDLRRVDNEDYWIRRWWGTVNTLPVGTNIVVDDVRFLNEARHVTRYGGVLFRINGVTPASRFNTHQSETEQAHIEVAEVITNQKTKEEFEVCIRNLAVRLLNPSGIPVKPD